MHSASHIESLWNALKNEIKKIYNMIPNKYFTKFLREAKWKYLNKNKNHSEKIKELFQDYTYINNLSDVIVNNNGFLSDSDRDGDSYANS